MLSLVKEVFSERNIVVLSTTSCFYQVFRAIWQLWWSLYLLEELNAPIVVVGLLSTIQSVSQIIFQFPGGVLADKIGRKKTFYLFFPCGVIGTLLVIFAPSPEYFILAGIIGYFGATGGLFGGRQIPFFTMTHEMVPAEQRGRWMGIIGIIRIFTFPASIVGGIMWGQGLMTEVLLFPIFVQCLIMIPLFHTIPETLKPHTIEIEQDREEKKDL